MGTITQETTQGTALYYRCVILIDEAQLIDSKENVVEAQKSMPVVARIVYDEETYLNWLLDMLNFTN